MPRHSSSSKSSSHALREPEFASSSTSAPFDPTGGKGMSAIKPYGGGSSAHSRGESALLKVAPHPSGHSSFIGSGGAKAGSHGQAPQATSMPGSLGIIEHPSGGKDRNMGIPGLLSSTSLGPQQRQNIVAGIIESPMNASRDSSGPVHAILGHDATAYNEGMVHIAGSSHSR